VLKPAVLKPAVLKPTESDPIADRSSFTGKTKSMGKKIALFYGTQTGKTETVAEMIRDEWGGDSVDRARGTIRRSGD
jgi:sulfite reductase alpha subunit-like flavoprotein